MPTIVKETVPISDEQRTIRVFLPSDYYWNEEKSYPVLYMHDGQNLFDPSEASFGKAWNIGSAMEVLESQHEIEDIIIIGIDSNTRGYGRMNEFSPWVHNRPDYVQGVPEINAGGEGDKYVDFIVHGVKPFIDHQYRTLPERQNTAIAGSSLGALISIYAGLKYNHIFSKIGALSPALWFAKNELLNYVRNCELENEMKIYIDVGTEETSYHKIAEFPQIYLNDTLELHGALKEKNIDEYHLKLFIEDGAKHNEESWGRRFYGFVTWMFGELCEAKI